MSVLEGKIAGPAASGTLFTLSKSEDLYQNGYDLESAPSAYEGKEIITSVGNLFTKAISSDNYRWGTWRVMDTHEDPLIGYVSDQYAHGMRTVTGSAIENNKILLERIPTKSSGTGVIRNAIKGVKVKQNDPGMDWCIKVKIPVRQVALQGKTWGDWSYDGSGIGSMKHLRPRRYPDTHIPVRREGT
ncbi:hypothetical protein HUB98_05270 [Paenibacillus barcinonensis]|uniref:Uncharacterized protein n=1 Tax=Paenibacillus barcinonensis TaxID=198119 RepID=A0A2V4VVC2_PAEBA|nr:hypothetical protein [Paenibacillus barcinonensis]PYE51397.1 hypothetical protein DFQ00_102191 [Paenibacillus barcinonensis]QKS55793.1 hypothetical protein HUB98_05270 [Paenibacillus barcinonensis]